MRHGRKRERAADLIAEVPLFLGCSQKELARIGSLVTEVAVPAGKVLCREGEAGTEAFIIAEGEADVALKRKKLARLGPGQIVGEMSLIDQAPRSATVTAVTDMTLFVLDAREFWTMVSENPLVARKLLKNLAQRLRTVEGAPTH
jgi:CRP-like cAMP-binding protein